LISTFISIVPYGSWYDYVQEFERAKDAGKQNILIIHYEDIKQVGMQEKV